MRAQWVLGSVLVVLAIGSLAACGGEDDTATTAPGSGSGSGPEPRPTSELTVSVVPAAGVEPRVWTLTCDPPGGDHPDPAAACAALEADPAALDAVSPDLACTEIYGGDQTATVTGTWRGEPVEAELSRINGCEIDRWTRLQPLLVDAGGVQQ